MLYLTLLSVAVRIVSAGVVISERGMEGMWKETALA